MASTATTMAATGTIVGYFEDRATAARAVEALHQAGFSSAHLGLAHRGDQYSDQASNTASNTTTTRSADDSGDGRGVWDRIKGFFGDDASEPYADERSRGDLADREITASPASSTNAAYHDDFQHNLTGLNVDEDRSRYFGHRLGRDNDGVVVTVSAGDRNGDAESILRQYGADFGERASEYDYTDTAPAAATGRAAEVNEQPATIQLLGEVLRVHKDRVSRGEVRLHKEVVTEMQTVQVPVTREELVIERRTVDGMQAASGTVGEGQDIRIPLTEERASIDKGTVVREEVSVAKKTVEETRNLDGQVSREELVVDDTTDRTRTDR